MEISLNNKIYNVIEKPYPHILVDSKKEIHGWFYSKASGRRECTSERLLINPYNGCSFNCFFCYARAFTIRRFWSENEENYAQFKNFHVVIVYKDFDKIVAKQLDSIKIASCGYLSPITDPFQQINEKYKLSEGIIAEFVKRNIPIEFVTKGKISDEAINLIKKQEHSFGQISILTLNDELRKKLTNGASTEILLKNFERLYDNNIYVVARIDPILPHLNDNPQDLRNLIKEVKKRGAKHIIASCVDILKPISAQFYEGLTRIDRNLVPKYKALYTENIGYYLNANINERKRLFENLKQICNDEKISFSLCMEFEKTNIKGRETLSGLNHLYSTSLNCEGMNVPVYVKSAGNGKFQSLNKCKGNCLTCGNCQLTPELAQAKALKLADYKRLGKIFENKFQTKVSRFNL
ncbi:MAG: radical SAM protein [Candidatus Altarchaeum sp.]|nr:radical SAM protein [Candidatus Altarchaeum sp.]